MSAPATLQLFDKDKSVEVKLNEKDFDLGSASTTFCDKGSQRYRSGAPESWQNRMDEPDTLYMLNTIPSETKVQIAATFWQTKDGIYARGFSYKGIGSSQYSSQAYLTPCSD